MNEDNESLSNLLNQIDKGEIESLIDEESAKFLLELHESSNVINENTMDDLLETCKDVVVNSIIGTFGLSRALFNDKDGGPVTTSQNFEKGITSNEEDQNRFKMLKSSLASESIRQDGSRIVKKTTDSAKKKADPIIDDYTGRIIPKDGRTHIDHIVSISEAHRNPDFNFIYSFEEQVNILHNERNLAFTERKINQSKSNKDLIDWAEINGSKYGIDKEKIKPIHKQAKDSVYGNIPEKKLNKYSKELSKVAVTEGLALGIREAVGIILKEFVSELFREIKTIIKYGLNNKDSDSSVLTELKNRFSTIWDKAIENCIKKNKDITSAFKDGFVSGISSSILTFLINMVLTTVKRVVRILREGILSLYRAIKMLINPPENLPKEDLYFEIIKLISASIITSFGLLLEEGFEKFLLTTPLAPIANYIAPVLMGILTGISIAVIIYTLDKIMNRIKRDDIALTSLYGKIGKNYFEIVKTEFFLNEAENLFDNLDREFDKMEDDFYS